MQMEVGFRHVDVFSASPLGGNGLGVVLPDQPLDASLMLAITRELRQFETIFLERVDDDGADAQVFTPDGPLDFAGHPVLGAAAVLHWERRPTAGEATWTIRLSGRPLTVRTNQTAGADRSAFVVDMNQGAAAFGRVLSGAESADVARFFGLASAQVRDDLPAQVVSTGLPYLILPVTADGLSAAGVRAPLLPDRLTEYGARFAYVLDPDRPEGRSWDDAGAVEDVATGSADGPDRSPHISWSSVGGRRTRTSLCIRAALWAVPASCTPVETRTARSGWVVRWRCSAAACCVCSRSSPSTALFDFLPAVHRFGEVGRFGRAVL